MPKPPTRYERPLPPPTISHPENITYPAFYVQLDVAARIGHVYPSRSAAIKSAIEQLDATRPGYHSASVLQRGSRYDRRVWYGVRDS